MTLPATVHELIDLWPSKPALARKLSTVKHDGGTVWYWFRVKRIPEKHWAGIVAAADLCGFEGITYEMIANLHRT